MPFMTKPQQLIVNKLDLIICVCMFVCGWSQKLIFFFFDGNSGMSIVIAFLVVIFPAHNREQGAAGNSNECVFVAFGSSSAKE